MLSINSSVKEKLIIHPVFFFFPLLLNSTPVVFYFDDFTTIIITDYKIAEVFIQFCLKIPCFFFL